MIQTQVDSLTGLPRIVESRDTRKPWAALPRKPFGDFCEQPGTWHPAYQTWNGHHHQRIGCWKCGIDLWSHRQALQPTGRGSGQPITVAGQPAVHFLPLPHYRAKRFAVHRPAMLDQVTFDVLHCADCTIEAAHGEAVVSCYLAGLYASYRHAVSMETAILTPHEVASYFARWAKAEPIGPVLRDPTAPFWRS